jgi:hypothetical protein
MMNSEILVLLQEMNWVVVELELELGLANMPQMWSP